MELSTILNGEMLGYDQERLPPDSPLPLQKPQVLDVVQDVTESSQLNKTEMKIERLEGKIEFFNSYIIKEVSSSIARLYNS